MNAWFTLLLAMLPLPLSPSQNDVEIARLVKQLGSSDYRTRDGATKRLREIGEPALDALHKVATHDDLEVSRRAGQLVAFLENNLYGPELRLAGHTGIVYCVSVSSDGKRLLTGGEDNTVRLWDTDTGQCLRVFEGHTARVNGAVLSPDGQRMLSAGSDDTVRLWDTATGHVLHKMTGHDRAESVAFGPEGKAISGGWDNKVNLWDLNTGKKAGVFTSHTDYVRTVVYSDRAGLAATASGGGEICLWNLETGVEVRRASGGARVGYSADGKRLVASGNDATLHIWDVASGKELQPIRTAHKPQAFTAALSPDGQRVVSGGQDATVCVWDVATGKELRKYEGHKHYVVGVAFFPNGKRIASASWDGTVRIWRAPR